MKGYTAKVGLRKPMRPRTFIIQGRPVWYDEIRDWSFKYEGYVYQTQRVYRTWER